MDLNSTINNATNIVTNSSQTSSVIVTILQWIGTVSQFLANQIYLFLTGIGIPISQLGAGILLLFIFVGLILLINKITKPILKILFWILVAVFIFGLFVGI